MPARYPKEFVTAAVLAGGRARRMGGLDKGLVELEKGRPMIGFVLNALRPQVHDLMISANRNIDEYAQFTKRVVTDGIADFQGPLTGIAACLEACKTPYLLTVPCDSPLVAPDLAPRLFLGLNDQSADMAVRRTGYAYNPPLP